MDSWSGREFQPFQGVGHRLSDSLMVDPPFEPGTQVDTDDDMDDNTHEEQPEEEEQPDEEAYVDPLADAVAQAPSPPITGILACMEYITELANKLPEHKYMEQLRADVNLWLAEAACVLSRVETPGLCPSVEDLQVVERRYNTLCEACAHIVDSSTPSSSTTAPDAAPDATPDATPDAIIGEIIDLCDPPPSKRRRCRHKSTLKE